MLISDKSFTVAQIRQTFLDFFAERGHTVVPSSPLVPLNDPTLMFTNSGMVQFKDVFLGTDKRPYVRAASVQACLRAGGKHNDLENVGYTARHHTFFEMLGNWSFGDYFKKEAIAWGWELLTQVYGLPTERLLVTVYHDDDEAYEAWTRVIGLPPERVIRIGDNQGGKFKSDNFWMMADTGPCGPCSEVFYDHGAHIPGGPPGSADQDGDRFIEIWNFVFMQYDMAEDGSVTPLPALSVDTGMGLERLAAIMQGVHSNYEIDLFQALITAAARETGASELANPSLKVIADHIRASAFLVTDGVVPGNEGRGYVQRRIIRRAIRHGYKLGQESPFFHKLVPDLVQQMGDAYPKLREQQGHITEVLKAEEERFFETLAHGMTLLDSEFERMPENSLANYLRAQESDGEWGAEIVNRKTVRLYKKLSESGGILQGQAFGEPAYKDTIKEIPFERIGSGFQLGDGRRVTDTQLEPFQILSGKKAFVLHDTYGFPLDLTQDVCRERGVQVDVDAFDAAMEEQRRMGRAAGHFTMDRALEYEGPEGLFTGYDELAALGEVVALYRDGTATDALQEGETGVVVLDTTPFYAESGGQVGDQGALSGNELRFAVNDTQKIKAHVFGHYGVQKQGALRVGETVLAEVNVKLRADTMRNHSVTHLMHKALREVLGPHVQQKGSLVDAQKTRFDFAHDKPMTEAQIREVERRVNAEILANTATHARVMPMEEAKKSGALMLFGEKYGEQVRVLDIGSSREFCGGTHVARTGDIGLFKIVSEGGVAAGIRRVEAITGTNALAYLQMLESTVHGAADELKVPTSELTQRISGALAQIRTLEKELAALKSRLASSRGDELLAQAVDLGAIKVLAARLDGADAKTLRETVDKLKDKLGAAAIVLGAVQGERVQLAAGVTRAETGRVKAGELVNFVAQQVGGKGGGRPDMAMAGGSDATALPAALQSVRDWVAERI